MLLKISVAIYLSIYLSNSAHIYLSVYLSNSVHIYLSNSVHIYLSIYHPKQNVKKTIHCPCSSFISKSKIVLTVFLVAVVSIYLFIYLAINHCVHVYLAQLLIFTPGSHVSHSDTHIHRHMHAQIYLFLSVFYH